MLTCQLPRWVHAILKIARELEQATSRRNIEADGACSLQRLRQHRACAFLGKRTQADRRAPPITKRALILVFILREKKKQ